MTVRASLYSCERLSKSFSAELVLSDVTLTLWDGDMALLLGANGVGKTTLLRLCVGLSRPQTGSILVESKPLCGSHYPSLGYLGHASLLYPALTVHENLSLTAQLLKLKLKLPEIIEEWGLARHAHRRIDELSRGLHYRVALCRALLHSPRFVFLDEPTSSLDEEGTLILMRKLNELLSRKEEQRFILIATHDVRRLAEYANRVVVLRDGRVFRDSAAQGAGQAQHSGLSADEATRYYLDANL